MFFALTFEILLVALVIFFALAWLAFFFWMRRAVRMHAEASESLELRTKALATEREIVVQERDQLNAIFSSTQEGFLVFDQQHKIIRMNQVASKLLRTAQRMEGWDVNDIFQLFKEEKSYGDMHEFVARVIEQTDFVRVKMADNVSCRNRFGADFPIELIMVPLLQKRKPQGALLIFRDVTRERDINRAKTEFVTLASHQLRTPLSAMKLFLEMLADKEVGSLTVLQKEYVQFVKESTDRMIRLVNDLLNISRLESGRLKIETKPIKLDVFLQKIIRELGPIIKKSKCDLGFQGPDSPVPLVPIDEVLLRQVVRNLIANAVRYSEGTTHCSVFVKLKIGEGGYRIEVIDQGIGIPAEVQENIFKKFFRADNAMKKQPEGSGLGLYIAKMVMDASGGTIGFTSRDGGGSTFYVTIPKSGMVEKSGEKGFAV